LGKSNEGQEQAKMTEQHSETNNFCAESLGIPTQEEWSNEILTPIKTEKNEAWSEGYAEKILKEIDFPELQKVDGNLAYNKLIKKRQRSKSLPDMITPDFVVGDHFIEPNDPVDFYVDIHEVTEGLWGNFNDDKNKFPHGNPIKAMYEAVISNPEKYTSDNPYFLPLTETDCNLTAKLYENIKNKAKGYCNRRDGQTSRFGMVSVMSNKNHHITMVAYQKLILSVFDEMIIPFIMANHTYKEIELIRQIKHKAVSISSKPEIITLAFPFEGNWTFWLIVGTGTFEGHLLLLINQNGMNKLDLKSDVYKWLMKRTSETSNEYQREPFNVFNNS
jgi:hypothetical protein